MGSWSPNYHSGSRDSFFSAESYRRFLLPHFRLPAPISRRRRAKQSLKTLRLAFSAAGIAEKPAISVSSPADYDGGLGFRLSISGDLVCYLTGDLVCNLTGDVNPVGDLTGGINLDYFLLACRVDATRGVGRLVRLSFILLCCGLGGPIWACEFWRVVVW
ncbi:hypothetical protein KSP40_PGU019019 [Platanthera guangdongensis]|uniref:Uncharacterized protein n=1 Tax=Platanthera guangdongensis TaxID=2320717 RepID=A0ABR2M031_9ASPA